MANHSVTHIATHRSHDSRGYLHRGWLEEHGDVVAWWHKEATHAVHLEECFCSYVGHLEFRSAICLPDAARAAADAAPSG